MPAARFFRDVLSITIVKIYYAHPLAWNEIGYNGPSSPRGHVRTWEGGVDPWEAQERGEDEGGGMNKKSLDDTGTPSSLRPHPSPLGEWALTAPGTHGERVPMRDLSREEADFCVVGAGAGGGVVGAKLAEAGFSVVILDAGPHWNPIRDFVSDETASRKLYWTDERVTGGRDPVELGSNNSGRGVGGGTVHYSMVKMRAHPEDFRRRTLEGEIAGAELCDWPITFEDLEHYYEEVEEALQIAGPTRYPWGRRRRRFPQREHELNASANMLVIGCTKLGVPVAPAPVSTLSAPHKDRPPCVYRGFCNYGCSTNAKSSILLTYIPRAIRAGAEVRAGAMAARVSTNESGRVTGVLHFQKGAASSSDSAPGAWSSRVTPSRRRACCSTRQARSSPTASPTLRGWSASVSWCTPAIRSSRGSPAGSTNTRPRPDSRSPNISTARCRTRGSPAATRLRRSGRTRLISRRASRRRAGCGARNSGVRCSTTTTIRASASSAKSCRKQGTW